jgi:opacity protein-like surface antigen
VILLTGVAAGRIAAKGRAGTPAISICEAALDVGAFSAMTGSCRFACAALAAALLLAAPSLGLAQSKARAVVAPVAAPARPPPAPAPAPAPAVAPQDDGGAWQLGLAVGRESDSDSDLAGLRLQLELERDLVVLGERGRLSFVGAAGWFHGTMSGTTGVPGLTVTTETTANLFELIPSFRASFYVSPRLRFFGEVGVGGAWSRTAIDISNSTVPGVVVTAEKDAWAGVLRLSAGGSWQLTDRFQLGVELPTLHRRYGETTSQTLSFSAMAAYAF